MALSLPDQHENLIDFLNHSTLSVHLVDGEGVIKWANETELAFMGYAPGEYIGHHIAEFHVDADVIEAILGILSRGERLHAYPARLRARDGGIRHVLINSNVYFDAEGRFVHTRCFTNPISEAVYEILRAELAGTAV